MLAGNKVRAAKLSGAIAALPEIEPKVRLQE
jgi:hypothetical protein